VLSLPRASLAGTWQRQSLYRVPPNTLGKGTGKWAHGRLLCRGPVPKTLDKVSVTVTWRRDNDFSLPSVRQKVLRKKAVVDVQFTETSLPSVTPDEEFVECF
jgi:hypothetical protein